jgi:The GLUG motif
MIRNHIQFVLLSLVFVLSGMAQAADFAGGTGEPNDPYLIATAEQLRALDSHWHETYFRLCNDIDLDRQAGPRISFDGHLDGGGFEIRNVVGYWGGLFGTVGDWASITNLVVANVDVVATAWPDGVAVVAPVGAFAISNCGTITNCGVTGIVATWRFGCVGGFVGYNTGEIVDCYFDGDVIAPWEDINEGDELLPIHVGGLVGVNRGLIANCLTQATVLGNRGVGGLVGLNEGAIRNCYALGPVLGQVGAGGLVSENTGRLQTCYAANEVAGVMRGGLVGLAGESWGSASNCFWDASRTNCDWSAAGVRVSGRGFSPDTLALNGWAEDPNWVILTETYLTGRYSYRKYDARLAWEGVTGAMPPQPAETVFAEGSGTESDPYVIRTPEDLRALCESSIYWDQHFLLANDLDMPSNAYPIGICRGSGFSGTFDGNGHVIRNLRIGWPSSGTPVWNGGLFGYITGEVRNLILEDCEITGGVNSRRVGVLAGTNAGIVTNCSVTGSISVGEYSQFVGELIGVNYGQVNDCNAVVTVEAGEGSTEIGGLIGAEDPPFRR